MTSKAGEVDVSSVGCASLTGVDLISFLFDGRHTAYGCITDALRQFGYMRCKRTDKGVLMQYLLR